MNITLIILLTAAVAFIIYRSAKKEKLLKPAEKAILSATAILESIVEFSRPVLLKNGFTYIPGQSSSSSGGAFANGFFKSDKIEIGLIVRGNNLGAVNYSVEKGNISHDDMFIITNKEEEKRLWYDEDQNKSYTLENESLQEAFLLDIEKVILPYLNTKTKEEIKSIIQNAYNERWK